MDIETILVSLHKDLEQLKPIQPIYWFSFLTTESEETAGQIIRLLDDQMVKKIKDLVKTELPLKDHREKLLSPIIALTKSLTKSGDEYHLSAIYYPKSFFYAELLFQSKPDDDE